MRDERPTLGSLFAGIGGFDLGFERAGFRTAWQVEIDDWKRDLLTRRFPEAERFANVRECSSSNLRWVDVIAGGFPCQPFSTGGKRHGCDDDRYLWPEMLRVVHSLRPTFVLIENVAGLAHEFHSILGEICDDLEAEDYTVLPPLMVPLAAFGAWHRRDRVWILAHLDQSIRCPKQGQQQEERPQELHGGDAAFADNHSYECMWSEIYTRWRAKVQGEIDPTWRTWWDAEPGVGRMVHGISADMDRRRIAALGESVSPIAAEWIAHRIKAVMKESV